MTRREALAVLDLNAEPTDAAALAKAVRRAQMKHHTDRGGSAQRFQAVQDAADVLAVPARPTVSVSVHFGGFRQAHSRATQQRRESVTRGFNQKIRDAYAEQQKTWRDPKEFFELFSINIDAAHATVQGRGNGILDVTLEKLWFIKQKSSLPLQWVARRAPDLCGKYIKLNRGGDQLWMKVVEVEADAQCVKIALDTADMRQ